MKVATALLMLFLFACKHQTSESMKKEYDSIIVQKRHVESSLENTQAILNFLGKGHDTVSIMRLNREVDSLAILDKKLEDRQKELARELFGK
jgi:hypothetical protein